MHENGYAHLQGLIPVEVAQAFLQGLKQDMGPGAIPLSGVTGHVNLLNRPAFEVYGHHYKPMLYFLWGLTPTMSEIVGRELLPTYDYLRIYRAGDVCRVHSDRYSCEHSLSLTLGYSDGKVWDLEIASETDASRRRRSSEDFGERAYSAIAMEVGRRRPLPGRPPPPRPNRPNPNALVGPSLPSLGGPRRALSRACVRRADEARAGRFHFS